MTVSVLEAVDVHLSDKKVLWLLEKIFFSMFVSLLGELYANRPINLSYGTNTHSQITGFCSRLIGFKPYLDCLYE